MEFIEQESTAVGLPDSEIPRWPKRPAPLTEEQKRLQHEFLRIWHEILPKKYGMLEKFNHSSRLLKNSVTDHCKTLEIGAGLGEHLEYEDLSRQDYTALEIRDDFVDVIKSRFPSVKAVVGDIQKRLDFKDGHFDRILAIHVLEHLRNLPAALREIKRLLKPSGRLVVVIPCEGGVAYQVARRISAQRVFEKTFKTPYTPIIKNEHVSEAAEIIEELEKFFALEKTSYWPLKVPLIQPNLVIALSCTPLTTRII
jgi:SAM-dependent methyltransferase